MVRVENLYYLLCYAWDHADLAVERGVTGLPNDRAENLLGHVMLTRLGELLRRGLHREYVGVDEDLRSPRGKIDVAGCAKRLVKPSGRVPCSFDELSHDVLLNRVVATTVRRLAGVVSDAALSANLLALSRRIPMATPIEPTAQVFARLRLNRLTSHYELVLSLCELVCQNLLPKADGGWRFVDFTGDERAMGHLFEAFLRNFLRHEQSRLHIGRDIIHWPAQAITRGSEAVLPRMQTDITARCGTRRCIIEAKYAKDPMRPGRDQRRRLREAHLYQLFAYLEHMDAAGRPVDSGVLVYAAAGDRFDHRFRLGDRELRAFALDLNQPWALIRADLLAFAGSVLALAPARHSGAERHDADFFSSL